MKTEARWIVFDVYFPCQVLLISSFGLFVLMMHNCSFYITSTNGYLNWSICMLSASDVMAHFVEDAANSMSFIIFCFNVMLIILFTGISNQNTTSKTSTPSSKPSPTYNINCVANMNYYPQSVLAELPSSLVIQRLANMFMDHLGDLTSSIRA